MRVSSASTAAASDAAPVRPASVKIVVEVVDVLRADADEAFIVLEVVVAIRQQGSALSNRHKGDPGPLGVLLDRAEKRSAERDSREVARFRREIAQRPDGVQPAQQVRDRPKAQRFRARLVHEARIQVCNLARRPALTVAIGGDALDDRAHVAFSFVRELDERSVGDPVRRHRCTCEPSAVGSAKKVVLGADSWIEIAQVKARGGRLRRRQRDG